MKCGNTALSSRDNTAGCHGRARGARCNSLSVDWLLRRRRWDASAHDTTLRLNPIGLGCRNRLPRLVPGLHLQKLDAVWTSPKCIIHDGVFIHPRNARLDVFDVGRDVVAAGPDRDCICKFLVLVVSGRTPEIELSANAIHPVVEGGDFVALAVSALPGAIVEIDPLGGSPLGGNSARPHRAGIFMPDCCWLHYSILHEMPYRRAQSFALTCCVVLYCSTAAFGTTMTVPFGGIYPRKEMMAATVQVI